MQENIPELQRQLKTLLVNGKMCERVLRQDEKTIGISELMDKVEAYRMALQDKNHILICAENSFDWIAVFLTGMLYSKQICAVDAHMEIGLLDKIVSDIAPDLIISERKIHDAIGFGSVLRRKPTEHMEGTEPTFILFTTGTTGSPKGVVMKLSNFMSNLFSAEEAFQIDDTETVALITPFSHSMGFIMMLLALCYSKEALIISNEIQILEALKNEKIDVMTVPPVLISMLQNREEYIKNLKRFRMLISGGAGLRKESFQYYHDQGVNLINGYGMTECCPVVALTGSGQRGDELKPLSWCKLKISEQGELCIKGPSLCTFYYGGERIPDEDGWFHTRDAAKISGETLTILYRMDNVYVMENGYKVNLEDLENRVTGISEITDCRAFIKNHQGKDILCLEILMEEYEDVPKQKKVEKKIAKILYHYEQVKEMIFTNKVSTVGGKKRRYERN